MIDHPNICRLYEIIEDEKKILLIMEFAKKGDLFEYIVKNHHLKEKEARDFFFQLL